MDPGMKLVRSITVILARVFIHWMHTQVLASMGPHVAGWSLSRVRSSDEWRVHSSLTVPHNVTGLDSRSGIRLVLLSSPIAQLKHEMRLRLTSSRHRSRIDGLYTSLGERPPDVVTKVDSTVSTVSTLILSLLC